MKATLALGLACALGCAVSAPPPPAHRPPEASPARAAPRAPEPAPAPAPPPACVDALDGALARESCDGSRLLLAHPVELHPDRPVPAEPSRSVLVAVSELLRSQPEILLVRIEVTVGRATGDGPESRRAALALAQRRADALLRYLWRRLGISAERLEAVAYEHRGRQSGSGAEEWPVVLRIVQRSRK